MGMTRDSAETLALKALTWLVANDELRSVFLGASGVSQAELAERAGDGDFLAAVLDFLVMDDGWVVAFCDANGLGYSDPMMARAHLPGGEAVHWT